jgi:hypothetical protein
MLEVLEDRAAQGPLLRARARGRPSLPIEAEHQVGLL